MEENIEAHDERYTKGATEVPKYEIGTYILAMNEDRKREKMDLAWHGPYRITKMKERPQGTIYTVYDPKADKEYDYHAAYVKPVQCKDDKEASIRSAYDDASYIVEKIIGHKKHDDDNTLDLQVKLHGEPIPKWVKYNTGIKANPTVKKYIESQNIGKIVPISKRKLNLQEDSYESDNELVPKKVRFILETDT
jgi:hypothetical protein